MIINDIVIVNPHYYFYAKSYIFHRGQQTLQLNTPVKIKILNTTFKILLKKFHNY